MNARGDARGDLEALPPPIFWAEGHGRFAFMDFGETESGSAGRLLMLDRVFAGRCLG